MLSCDVFRITWSTIVVWVLLIMSTLVLSAKEVFQLMHSQKLYFLNWENWVQWGIIINVVMVSFHRNPLENINKFTFLVTRWQHHAAAVGVFLVWGELMLMVGRLPTFGKFSFLGGDESYFINPKGIKSLRVDIYLFLLT